MQEVIRLFTMAVLLNVLYRHQQTSQILSYNYITATIVKKVCIYDETFYWLRNSNVKIIVIKIMDNVDTPPRYPLKSATKDKVQW